MIRQPSSFGALLRINLKAFWAVCLSVAAYLIWPKTLEWWGLGFTSICLGLAAFGLMVNALRIAMKLHMRRKTLEAYAAQGSRPKTAQMASEQALKNSGML